MNEEQLYACVLDELENSPPRTGLWAKAFADAKGSEKLTHALYLKYRAGQIAEEEKFERKRHLSSLPFPQRFSDDQWYGMGLALIVVVLLFFYYVI